MALPPGIPYLVGLLPRLLFPCAAVYALTDTLFAHISSIQIPTYLRWILVALSTPLSIVLEIQLKFWREKTQAKAMGAEFPPIIPGKMPGNIDVVSAFVQGMQTGYCGDIMGEYFKKLDSQTIIFRGLWVNRVVTIEPEAIKVPYPERITLYPFVREVQNQTLTNAQSILATDFNNYEKGSHWISCARSVLGDGVFNADGEMWKFHRAMTRPFFSKDRISDFDIFERHALQVVELLKARVAEGVAVDLQDVFGRFTLDSATEFLFGKDVHSLDAGLPYPWNVQQTKRVPHHSDEFAWSFNEAQVDIAERTWFGPSWRLGEMFKDRTADKMKTISAFIEPIIQATLDDKKSKKVSSVEEAKGEVTEDTTLIAHLVNQTNNIRTIKDETLNILIAGRDTTAATLTFVTYFLSLHPEVTARLRKEILTRVGMRRPTYEDIRDMKYLRAVINETLRLLPPVPFDIRQSVNSTIWRQNGKNLYIPGNTPVTYSVLLMHRRTDLWGPDAEVFDPDRWLDERVSKYLTPRPFIFLPFNAGPRICLGQQFAYNESSFMLVRFLQHFESIALDPVAQPPEGRVPADWANAPGRKAIERFRPRSHLTMYADKGLWANMKPALPVEDA